MNKNTKVALIEYNINVDAITDIYEIYNLDYAPLALKNASNDKSKNIIKELNTWFKNRGIPSWRKDLENLLNKLNVSSVDELLNKAYGLSLSDQYFIKNEEDDIKWEDINFFTNDFKYKAYLTASLSNSLCKERPDLYSPNNTTDGMLQKAWIIEDKNRVLVKGTYTASRQEPINEWLASSICSRLGFNYCEYSIDLIDNKIVSKCNNFLNSDEEIITANDIFNSVKKNNNESDFNHYLKILEDNKVPNARINLENMFILDYIIMNTDRHMKNYGVIRNVNTLEWIKLTPIFDNGQSMECEKLSNEISFNDGYGKYFTNINKKFSEYLKNIKDFSRIDISKLDGIVEEYKNILLKYQSYTNITTERVDILTNGLKKRISKLEKHINSVN
jgi:hypothetical protein